MQRMNLSLSFMHLRHFVNFHNPFRPIMRKRWLWKIRLDTMSQNGHHCTRKVNLRQQALLSEHPVLPHNGQNRRNRSKYVDRKRCARVLTNIQSAWGATTKRYCTDQYCSASFTKWSWIYSKGIHARGSRGRMEAKWFTVE
jgi:hypothetical protein